MNGSLKLSLFVSLITVQQYIILCWGNEPDSNLDCLNIPNAPQTVKLFSTSKKGITGKWEDSFATLTNTSIESKELTLEITHKVSECKGRRLLYIQGIINGDSFKSSKSSIERLTFHPKTGYNVALLNGGRTAQKINLEEGGNSIVFTKRPLRDNEIFEVTLEKKNTKFSESLGIGLTIKSPEDTKLTPYMWTSSFAWMLHHNVVHNGGKHILKFYGENIDSLKVGERLGVMRSEFGAIHFFVNGIDQGPAVSYVPKPVYGVLDLYQNAARATIRD